MSGYADTHSDFTGDAYANLIPEYGFQRLVQMLGEACDHGVESVEEAPPELIALMREMEQVPDWIDMELIEEGAEGERNFLTNTLHYLMQVGFVSSFMNKYTCLPLAVTGQLSGATARRRAFETYTYLVTTALPKSLERHGRGFKAAAMVRVMHSMVRFNLLSRGRWDSKTYGMPIPHVDQMPGGLVLIYLMCQEILATGRTTFTRAERARVEHSRYRAHLLGLPEVLLPTTLEDIVDMYEARMATLRDVYDEDICGGLVRATLAADFRYDTSLRSRLRRALSQSYGKFFFTRRLVHGDKAKAASFGQTPNWADYLRAPAMIALIVSRTLWYKVAARIPALRGPADRQLVRRMERLLKGWGHAEFVSDAGAYRPAMKKAA
jgi:hypothetical protein